MSSNFFSQLVSNTLDDAQRGALIAYCVEEIERADRVVSAPGLANRVWLGPRRDGYEGSATYHLINNMPRVAQLVSAYAGPETAPAQSAVPLGALVEVNLGQAEPAIAEVVWKEGAHPVLSSGYLPGWLAGAPTLSYSLDDSETAAASSSPVLRERLVLDFSCLGNALVPSVSRMKRLCDSARWIDSFGHLVMDMEYEPGSDDDDDIAYWASWITTHYADALHTVGVDPDPSAIRHSVAQLIDAVSENSAVRAFGPYLMSTNRYQELRREFGDIYENVTRGLAHVYRGGRRAWGSMSQRLAERISENMTGAVWSDQVVAASLYALDTLSKEAPNGDWNGVHLRLDDVWQGGGIWRAEILNDVAPLALDPSLALGLGWAEHTGQFADLPQTAPAPSWLAEVDTDDELAINDSEVVWNVHVSARDIDEDRLVVPPRLRPVLELALESAGQNRLVTHVHHVGTPDTHTWGTLGTGNLTVEWPPTVQVGTIFLAVWSLEGRPVVHASSRRLAEPVEIGGATYVHEFDLQMVLAHLGLIERPAQVVTLERLVRAAVRHYGELLPSGQRYLSVDEICAKCFGPDGQVAPQYQSFVLRRAIDAAVLRLVRSGRATRQDENVFVEDVASQSSTLDQTLLDRYVEGQAQRLRRAASRAWIPATIVNLPEGWQASPEKKAAWDAVSGTDHLPSGELGPNQTWRVPHVRGEALPSDIAQQLERTLRAVTEIGASPDHLATLREAVQNPGLESSSPLETSNNPIESHGEQE